MKTVALRFSDNFAPAEGTIQAHKTIIDKKLQEAVFKTFV